MWFQRLGILLTSENCASALAPAAASFIVDQMPGGTIVPVALFLVAFCARRACVRACARGGCAVLRQGFPALDVGRRQASPARSCSCVFFSTTMMMRRCMSTLARAVKVVKPGHITYVAMGWRLLQALAWSRLFSFGHYDVVPDRTCWCLPPCFRAAPQVRILLRLTSVV